MNNPFRTEQNLQVKKPEPETPVKYLEAESPKGKESGQVFGMMKMAINEAIKLHEGWDNAEKQKKITEVDGVLLNYFPRGNEAEDTAAAMFLEQSDGRIFLPNAFKNEGDHILNLIDSLAKGDLAFSSWMGYVTLAGKPEVIPPPFLLANVKAFKGKIENHGSLGWSVTLDVEEVKTLPSEI